MTPNKAISHSDELTMSLNATLRNRRRWRVGVISNPHSGANRKGMGAIRDILHRQPHMLHHEALTLADTAAALIEFEHHAVDVVAVNGGDGTIQTVLTAMFNHNPFRRLPLLAILRGGTDSVIARDIGIRGSRDRGLRKLVKRARSADRSGVIVQRPILRVQMSSQPQPSYGMIFGGGVIYQGIQFCRQNIHTRGLHGQLAPGLTLVRFLLGILRKKPHYAITESFSIGLDQKDPVQGDFLMILVSTLEHLFLGIRPFWGPETGPLHFTAIRAGARHLMRVLPSMARGQKCRWRTSLNGYLSHNSNEVRVTLNSGFTLDGELHPKGSRPEQIVLTSGGQAAFLIL